MFDRSRFLVFACLFGMAVPAVANTRRAPARGQTVVMLLKARLAKQARPTPALARNLARDHQFEKSASALAAQTRSPAGGMWNRFQLWRAKRTFFREARSLDAWSPGPTLVDAIKGLEILSRSPDDKIKKDAQLLKRSTIRLFEARKVLKDVQRQRRAERRGVRAQ